MRAIPSAGPQQLSSPIGARGGHGCVGHMAAAGRHSCSPELARHLSAGLVMDMQQFAHASLGVAAQVALRIGGAIALWLVGRWLIQLAVRLVHRALARQLSRRDAGADLETATSVC